MTRLSTNSTLSESITQKFETSAANENTLSSSELETNRNAWQDIIDHKLIEWGLNSGFSDSDGIISPSRESVTEAIKIAKIMSSEGLPTPRSVVPNGDGGIVFERKCGSVFETIEIFEDGLKEYSIFTNSKLHQRGPIEIE